MRRSLTIPDWICETCGEAGMTYTVISEPGAGGDGILSCDHCGAEVSAELTEAQRQQIFEIGKRKPS